MLSVTAAMRLVVINNGMLKAVQVQRLDPNHSDVVQRDHASIINAFYLNWDIEFGRTMRLGLLNCQEFRDRC